MPSKKKNNKKNKKNNEKEKSAINDEQVENNSGEENEKKQTTTNEFTSAREDTQDVSASSNEKTRVDTEIFGEEFSIIGDMQSEEIKRIAGMVDEKMRQANNRYPKLSYHKIAILAALNIAEEYVNLENEHKRLIELMEKQNSKGKK